LIESYESISSADVNLDLGLDDMLEILLEQLPLQRAWRGGAGGPPKATSLEGLAFVLCYLLVILLLLRPCLLPPKLIPNNMDNILKIIE
jgi:hypothetical protein